jgi:hypothetical protein
MLAGQRRLEGRHFRGRIFGAGELRLDDWFVPVLFQEKDDPQLFKMAPAKQTLADFQSALAARLGELPKNRNRLRRPQPGAARPATPVPEAANATPCYAARAAKARPRSPPSSPAGWCAPSRCAAPRSSRSKCTAESRGARCQLGGQLVGKDYSVATSATWKSHPAGRTRAGEQPTLLVVDNMESVLLPPFMAPRTRPRRSREDMRRELKTLLALCERLLPVGDTRLVFTSREALPAPFDAERNRRELHQLDRDDAVKLVERR